MNELVLTDRITGLNKAIVIYGGRMSFSGSLEDAQVEPVVADKANTGKAYRLFISGGRLGMEESEILIDHPVDIVDGVSGTIWRLSVISGRFYFRQSYAINITLTRVSFITIDGELVTSVTNSVSGNSDIESDKVIERIISRSASRERAVTRSVNRISNIN